MTIFFRRKMRGSRQTSNADLLVSVGNVSKHKGGRVLCLRLNSPVIKRARWIAGDSITAAFDEPGTWKLQRVGDGTGNALKSDADDNGRGAVRYTLGDGEFASLQMGSATHYTCSLSAIDGDTLVFQRD